MTQYLILAEYLIARDYTFTIGGYRFGFIDANHSFQGDVTLLHAGPLGEYYHVPVSALQGLMITALLFATLLAAMAWLCFRRRRVTS